MTHSIMVRGSFQLDLKRDDPRTLMIKIDRRSTFGGRERQHAYRLEAEREIRHINYAKQLSVAAFNRSHREMSKRNEFLKGLVESNQERRRLLEADLIQRGELIPKRRRSRKKNRNLSELPRKKPKPELHNASVVGSVRRDTMEYVGSRKQSDFLLRSLNEMNASEKKHLANQKQMMVLEEAKQDIMNGKIVDNVTAMEPMVTDSAGKSGKDFVAGKATVATRTLSLPQLSDLERRKAPVPVKPGLQKRMSLSNMISSGGISELQGQSTSKSFGGEKPGLARSFYLNTSRPQLKPTLPKFKLPPLPKPKVAEPPEESTKVNQSRFAVNLPPQLLPVEFSKEQVTENPFMNADFKPEILRTRELLENSKNDEMYVWLGFDSAEEFQELLEEARKQRPKKKKKKKKTTSNDGGVFTDSASNLEGSTNKEGANQSENDSSDSEDSLLAERLQEILAIDKSDEIEKPGSTEKTVASMSRRNSKFALMAPLSALGEGADRKLSLKKFVSAARKVLAVNAFKEQVDKDNTAENTEVDAAQS